MTSQPPGLPAPQGNILRQTVLRGKLVWRLMRDPRVSWLLKLIPAGGAAYAIWPFDLVIDLAPVIGQVDDLGILFSSLWLFVELCPPEIVREHWDALTAVVPGTWHEIKSGELPERFGEKTKTPKDKQP